MRFCFKYLILKTREQVNKKENYHKMLKAVLIMNNDVLNTKVDSKEPE